MKGRIKTYKEQLKEVHNEIQKDLVGYLRNANYEAASNDIQIVSLRSESDLLNIFSVTCFYFILTKKAFEDNECSFTYKDNTAIYRGHSYTVKNRILSHLANKFYNSNYDSTYKACIKVEDGQNGINIDQEPYSTWEWSVIIHKMKGSSKIIREQAEEAFDTIYG